MRRRGLSLAEILVATFVAALLFAAFLSVFENSYRYAATTRNRAMAIVLGRTLLDEVEAHPYGAPAPQRWTKSQEEPSRIWIEGKPVQMLFQKQFSYRNGSFIGKGKGGEDYDVVTIQLSWRESTGAKSMRLTVPVWR
jgi:hypothetical protein